MREADNEPAAGPILVKPIPMPLWQEELETENAGRAIAGDEAKI